MRALLALLALALACAARAQEQQPAMDYSLPQSYEIGGITVRDVSTRQSSLEDVFLSLVSEDVA